MLAMDGGRDAEREAGLEGGMDDSPPRWVVELRGDGGVDWEPKRKTDGGFKSPLPLMSDSSESSTTPAPPCFRHVRATRSAHSSTFTKRTAPESSSARGTVRRRMRTVG